MKRNNDFYFKIGMNGLLIVCGGILFYYILFHSDRLSEVIGSLLSILTPLLAGLVIAYILNPVMRFLEKKIFYPVWNRIKRRKDHVYSKEAKVIRVSSAIITIVIFLAIIYSIVLSLIPQLQTSVQSILSHIFVFDFEQFYLDWLQKYPRLNTIVSQYNLLSDRMYDYVNINKIVNDYIYPKLQEFVGNTSTSLFGTIITIFKSLLNFIIGIIIALYLLIDKEKFCAQAKKVLYAFLKHEKANNFLNNLRYSDKVFGGFITGKVIDSIIIGILCYFGMLILRLPYSVLISVLVGVTNVIPYFGPFIGAIPSAFFILMIDPKKCLVFLIFVLILQQFDGNVLGPKILGESTGLSSFWVIFSITVFSGLFGVFGMFMGVPLFAVIYAALKTMINKRLEIKHMPVETAYYIDSDFTYEDEEDTNSGKAFRFGSKAFDKVTKETIEEDEVRGLSKDRLLNEKDDITEQ